MGGINIRVDHAYGAPSIGSRKVGKSIVDREALKNELREELKNEMRIELENTVSSILQKLGVPSFKVLDVIETSPNHAAPLINHKESPVPRTIKVKNSALVYSI